jgi:hypothetical protein
MSEPGDPSEIKAWFDAHKVTLEIIAHAFLAAINPPGMVVDDGHSWAAEKLALDGYHDLRDVPATTPAGAAMSHEIDVCAQPTRLP